MMFEPLTEVVGAVGADGTWAAKIANGAESGLNPTEFRAMTLKT